LVPPDEARAFIGYVRRYYANVALADLRDRSVEFLAAAAHAHWQLAAIRPAATPLVRVYTPTRAREGWESTHTIVEIVNDDMPFLVDTVTMQLDRHGLGLHLVVHPIMRVRRDAEGRLLGIVDAADTDGNEGTVVAESVMHVEVDRETDAEMLSTTRDAVLGALSDLRSATSDWLPMLGALRRVADELVVHPPPLDTDELAEGRAFLDWMADQHFTFVGYRRYDLTDETGEEVLKPVPGTGLGVLRGTRKDRPTRLASLPPEVRRRVREKKLLILTKANSRSTVHRPAYLDYVGVKIFGPSGEVTGEHRFLGLWTSSMYNASPIDIPVVRRKLQSVIDRAGFEPQGHDQKDLIAILESYPRDDLFYANRTGGSCRASCSCLATVTPPRCACASRSSCSMPTPHRTTSGTHACRNPCSRA
jgi:glutamate dehydrogenase